MGKGRTREGRKGEIKEKEKKVRDCDSDDEERWKGGDRQKWRPR